MNPVALIVLPLLLLGTPVFAQSVHKCVDDRGGVTYQSGDCTDGRSVRSGNAGSPAGPDLDARKARERSNSAYLRKLAKRHRGGSGGAGAISGPRDARKCEAARNRRSRAEASTRRLTLAQLEKLGDDVYEACK